MNRTFGVFEQVIYEGEVFTVSRKRTGVDLYEICKVQEWYGEPFNSSPKVVTNIIDGLRAEELEPFIEESDKCEIDHEVNEHFEKGE